MTTNVGISWSTSAGAKSRPRAYWELQQASGMNCPYAGHESVSRASAGEVCYTTKHRSLSCFFASCLALLGGQAREEHKAGPPKLCA